MADNGWDDIIAEAGDMFNLPAPGTYQAVILSAEATVSKKSQNPMIVSKLKITEGPHAGHKLKDHYTVKDKDRVKAFFKNLAAVGISFDLIKAHRPTMEQIARTMVGKVVTVETEHDTFNGDTKLAVKWQLMPPASGAVAVTAFPAVASAEVPSGSTAAAGGYTADPGF